ncbi:MAG TPA: hypothetical protein VF590_09050, partial [Isosphaeraceae bacterium]
MHAEQRPSGVTGSPPPHRDASTRWSTPGRWALLAVVVALARPATHAAPPPPVDPKQQARERAGPHLDRADAECRHALTQDAARDLDSLAVGAALAQAAVRLG